MYRFTKPNRPVAKVFIHCSASDNPAHDNVATMDAWHKARGWSGIGYHLFVRKSGMVEMGRALEKTPAAQSGHNRGSLAICLHGLAEEKFTDAQKGTLVELCRQIDAAYGGAVTFHGHCEVAAKACPVIDYRAILDLDAAGRLGDVGAGEAAELVNHGDLADLEEAEADDWAPMSLRIGDSGPAVRHLQETLKSLGYHGGALDGDFGPLTRAAVLAFQADNHLVEDGIVGSGTFEALNDARPRTISPERRSKTVVGLARDGSQIAQASVAQGVIGTVLTTGGAVSVLEESTGMVTRISESLGVFRGVLGDLGPIIGGAVVVSGVLVVLQAMKAGRARRDDHRSAKTL